MQIIRKRVSIFAPPQANIFLETMLHGGITGPQAGILLIAKLAATTAVYAWGGAGGIFSPTLFSGAAIGLAFTDVCGLGLHLEPNDRIALTVAGMSACLGAVVRAPITSILIVFEMTTSSRLFLSS